MSDDTTACWFESATADDARTLQGLLDAHPTLLERVHPVFERSGLQLAAAWDASRVTAVLLTHGADVRRSDPDGLTAVHLAVAANGIATLELLLCHVRRHVMAPSRTEPEPRSEPAVVDQRSASGFTALLLAAALGHHECCALLLGIGGADPLLALTTPPHLTALDLALRGDHRAAAAVCLQHCARAASASAHAGWL